MGNESGVWIMHGAEDTTRDLILNADELTNYVNRVGFLPLFANKIKGFSVEEHALAKYWWTGDRLRDPWEWRMQIAGEHRLAYGKFFDGRAGFVSLEWLGRFANARRDGYDFDSLNEEGLCSARLKKIMDCFNCKEELFSFDIKRMAGFGKNGEKNFEGAMTYLQNRLYIVISDFGRRVNKKGEPYGWNVAMFSKPEDIWGKEIFSKAYEEPPEQSRAALEAQLNLCFNKR